MTKASFQLQPVGYPVYRAISQLNRQFEDQVEILDHLMSFNILPDTNLRTYRIMLEEIRALINNELHEILGDREFHNSAYYERLRLKWQQHAALKDVPLAGMSKSQSGQKQHGKPGRRASRQRRAVRQ